MIKESQKNEEKVVKQEDTTAKNQLVVGIIIAAVTVVLILGGTELIAYIWERNTAQGPLGWTLVASRRMDMILGGTAEQPFYIYQPGIEYEWEGIPVHINANGLRTEEIENPKPVDTYRILNLGDSIVFGWEVNQRETYGKQLEQLLNERNDGRKYEVINAGIPAWNLETERNFLLHEGLSYKPDLVILDVTVVNDIGATESPITGDAKVSIFTWLRDKTYSWPFITTQLRFLMAGESGPEAIPVLNPPQVPEEYFPLSEDSPAYKRTWSFISEIKTELNDHGIDLIVVMFPTAFQVNSFNHPDVPQRSLRKWTNEAEIELIDLLPIYQETCDESSPRSCEGYENMIFADVWMHPNSFGHQLAAEALYEKINRTLSE